MSSNQELEIFKEEPLSPSMSEDFEGVVVDDWVSSDDDYDDNKVSVGDTIIKEEIDANEGTYHPTYAHVATKLLEELNDFIKKEDVNEKDDNTEIKDNFEKVYVKSEVNNEIVEKQSPITEKQSESIEINNSKVEEKQFDKVEKCSNIWEFKKHDKFFMIMKLGKNIIYGPEWWCTFPEYQQKELAEKIKILIEKDPDGVHFLDGTFFIIRNNRLKIVDRRLVAYDDNGKRSLTTQPTFALTRNMKIRCPMSWLMVARQTRSRWGNEIKQMIHKNGGNMYKPFTFNGFRYKIIDSPFKHEKSVIKEGILKRIYT